MLLSKQLNEHGWNFINLLKNNFSADEIRELDSQNHFDKSSQNYMRILILVLTEEEIIEKIETKEVDVHTWQGENFLRKLHPTQIRRLFDEEIIVYDDFKGLIQLAYDDDEVRQMFGNGTLDRLNQIELFERRHSVFSLSGGGGQPR